VILVKSAAASAVIVTQCFGGAQFKEHAINSVELSHMCHVILKMSNLRKFPRKTNVHDKYDDGGHSKADATHHRQPVLPPNLREGHFERPLFQPTGTWQTTLLPTKVLHQCSSLCGNCKCLFDTEHRSYLPPTLFFTPVYVVMSRTMNVAAYPPPAPVGNTPTLYLTPQLEKRPDGLAPSLLDLSSAISNSESSSSVANKSYRTSSQFLKATPKDDSRELQTIVDSIMCTLEAMTDTERGTTDLASMTFEPQGCVWALEFNPNLRAQNYQLQVVCKGCADAEGHNAYVVDTMLVPKKKPSQADPGFNEAMAAFDFVSLQIRKAVVKLEFPDFPEGCKGRPFREVYQLNARLKSGSFATVCRGTHRATGKKVAIKCVLRKDLPPSDDAAIYDEVAILAALDHPHIVPLIDFFDEKDCYFIVMELMSGGDLFDRIGKKKSYSEADARELCAKMLKAMHYCHDLNIAHCDMKPKNLLLVVSL